MNPFCIHIIAMTSSSLVLSGPLANDIPCNKSSCKRFADGLKPARSPLEAGHFGVVEEICFSVASNDGQITDSGGIQLCITAGANDGTVPLWLQAGTIHRLHRGERRCRIFLCNICTIHTTKCASRTASQVAEKASYKGGNIVAARTSIRL